MGNPNEQLPVQYWSHTEVVKGQRPVLFVAHYLGVDGFEWWEFRDQLPLGFGRSEPIRDPSFLWKRDVTLEQVMRLKPGEAAHRLTKGHAWEISVHSDDFAWEFCKMVDEFEKKLAAGVQIAICYGRKLFIRWPMNGVDASQIHAARSIFPALAQIPLGQFKSRISQTPVMEVAEYGPSENVQIIIEKARKSGLDVFEGKHRHDGEEIGADGGS